MSPIGVEEGEKREREKQNKMDFILCSTASENLTREKFTSKIIKQLRIAINKNKTELNKEIA